MCKIRDVSELYALADKCARAEEGRKLLGENTGAGGSDSEDAAPARKNRRRNNRKRKGNIFTNGVEATRSMICLTAYKELKYFPRSIYDQDTIS